MKDEEPRAGLDSDPEPWVELAEVAIEHGSSPVRREQLVEAARDFELVRQAAVEGGVTLEPGQRAALDRLWEEATRRESRVVDAVGFDLEVAARDLRAFETRMLLENLAQARGLPSRHVDADLVLAYFEAHAHELPPLPEGEGRARAWRAIEIAIRQRLAPGVAARHEQGIAALLEELREASPDDGGYGPW